MSKRVEFWYDIVCPYAYLGSTQIERVAAECEATVEWRPFLLGGVFVAIGAGDNAMDSMSPAKLAHNFLDMQRWAAYFEQPLEIPSAHPRRTILALRSILAAGEENRQTASKALFRAYWVDGLDIADSDVVRRVLDQAKIDGAACVSNAVNPEIKAELRTRTEEAVNRGVFGAPSFFVGDEMFWGQDRLEFVRRALEALE